MGTTPRGVGVHHPIPIAAAPDLAWDVSLISYGPSPASSKLVLVSSTDRRQVSGEPSAFSDNQPRLLPGTRANLKLALSGSFFFPPDIFFILPSLFFVLSLGRTQLSSCHLRATSRKKKKKKTPPITCGPV